MLLRVSATEVQSCILGTRIESIHLPDVETFQGAALIATVWRSACVKREAIKMGGGGTCGKRGHTAEAPNFSL